jgi:aspartate aminotransferase
VRSKNLAHVEPGRLGPIRREVERRRAAGDDIIDLGSDESGLEASRSILGIAARAVEQEDMRHPDAGGILDLRAAAARLFSLLSGGRPVNADHIVVTNGARHALFSACFVLFETGDHVLVPVPSSPWVTGIVRLARATPVTVPGAVDWSLKVSARELEERSDARTAGVILNSPVDPTGAVYTRAELKSILEWASGRSLWVIVDESYRQLHYGSGPAPSVFDLPDELVQRAIVTSALGPSPGMVGWRVGVAAAPADVARAMVLLQQYTTGGASVPAQRSAAAVLTDERAEAERQQTIDLLREKRDRVVQFFRDRLAGIEFVDPLGGLYVFFRVDAFFEGEIDGAAAFCERLLDEQGVALAAGDVFGDGRWARLTYAAPDEDLDRGLERMAEFADALTKGRMP